jgi:eukaryotic-like serine/threonine-protein kinase
MRVLLIDDDANRSDVLKQQLTERLPQLDVVVRNPQHQGELAPEFIAQGFDSVLVPQRATEEQAFGRLRDLTARKGFAPIIYLGQPAGSAQARQAERLGAFAALGVQEVDSEHMLQVLSQAARQQGQVRAQWRGGTAGRETQRFGGAFIRGYRRIRQIAAGPVSDLYLAESEAAGALVAIKVARDQHREQSDLDHTFRRFLQEYQIVERIRHPSVVRLYDLGISDEHAWLVMEYFRAGDLRARMRAGMRPRPAFRTAIAIAHALAAIHAAGVLHRDLKPGNVMLREDGSMALIDFGMSKDAALAQDVTDTGLIFGTPSYMSPEQGHGEPIDARSDLYSLGVIVFEMLTQAKPYAAENPMAIIYKHRKEPVPQLPERFAALQPLLERFLAKDPRDRFADATQAARALEDAYRLLRRGAG